jgi:GNAT superfamily N-acetyltransferase/predicted nucleotidyltransferase
MDVVVEPLPDGAWQQLRDLRLQALSDAPDAFWATWADESRYGVAEWTRFTRSVAWFVAVQGDRHVGLVGAVRRDDGVEEHEVIGMWVDPAARRRGVAGLLLDEVARWAGARGAAALTLWVTPGNDEARRFYLRRGFTLTGEDAPLPGGRPGREVRMRRPFSDPPSVRSPQAPGLGARDGVPRHLRDLARSAVHRASNDPRVVGLVVAGSVARGTADEYSDLDLVVVCDDATHPEVLSDAEEFAASLGPLLVAFTGEHVGEPRLLIALYEPAHDDPGPRHVDLKVVSVSDLDSRIEDGLIVWQRDGAVDQAYARSNASWPVPDPQWIEDRFWVWLHYTTVKVARGELFEAVDALTFIRATALAPLVTAGKVADPAGVRRIEHLAPAVVPALRATLSDATVADCLRAAEATVELYLRLRDLTRIERRGGAERSARRYLSAVRARTGTRTT